MPPRALGEPAGLGGVYRSFRSLAVLSGDRLLGPGLSRFSLQAGSRGRALFARCGGDGAGAAGLSATADIGRCFRFCPKYERT